MSNLILCTVYCTILRMDSIENTPPKKPFWKRRPILTTLLVTLGIPLCTITLLFLWIKTVHRIPKPPLVISEETTRITGPLTADGHIDFLKALEEYVYPPEFATDENGYRDFVRQFGYVGDIRKPEDREFYRLQTYEKLGLDPNVPPTLTLPQLPHEIVKNFEYGQLWSLEQHPMLADWINEIDEPLDAIAEMIRKPVFFAPLLENPKSAQSRVPQNLGYLLMDDNFFQIYRLFSARAAYRIVMDDIDGAIDDKISQHRLGRFTAQRGRDYLMGVAIDGRLAMDIPIGAYPEHPLTEEQIRRLLEGLRSLPPRAPQSVAHEWMRYWMLNVVQDIAILIETDRQIPDEFTKMPRWLLSPKYDWNYVYRRVNEMYDAAQEPPPRENLRLIRESLDNTKKWHMLSWWLTHYAVEKTITHAILAISIPSVDFSARIEYADCAMNMQHLVLAILLYRLEHGTMPDENWAAQIKQYLGDNPEQYFSCPSNPAPEGETTYALIQYGDTVPENFDTLLLVELKESVPFDKATITVDEILAQKRMGSQHTGMLNTAYQSGAVRWLSEYTDEKELARLLGRGMNE